MLGSLLASATLTGSSMTAADEVKADSAHTENDRVSWPIQRFACGGRPRWSGDSDLEGRTSAHNHETPASGLRESRDWGSSAAITWHRGRGTRPARAARFGRASRPSTETSIRGSSGNNGFSENTCKISVFWRTAARRTKGMSQPIEGLRNSGQQLSRPVAERRHCDQGSAPRLGL
jgi:hypothetical protein